MIDGDSETVGEPIEPDLDVWAPWRPEDVARRLAGVSVPWYIAGGWAIDLFLGAEHRAHEDIEIGVPRDRFSEVASALGEFEFFVVGTPDGLAWPFAARADVRSEHHQTWVREPASGRWRLDIFREPAEGNMWICRRDTRIRLPYDRLIARAADGIPYARPEIVLLFKAKAARPNDENDFAVSLPYLDLDARGWLADALNLVHPGHHWLTKLR